MQNPEIRTYPVAVSYPEERPLYVRVEMGAGTLAIEPGAEVFVGGQVTCNVPEFAPQISVSSGNVWLRQRDGINLRALNNFKNDWQLKLGTSQPFGLIVKTGASRDTLRLGGLPLTGLKVEFGAGQTSVRFDSPNPQTAERLTFQVGAGQAHASGLLNANCGQIELEVGAGAAQLDFTGSELRQDTKVKISAGVGRVTLNVKQGIPTRIETEGFLSVVTTSGDYQTVGNGIRETPNYASATGPKLTVRVSTAMGKIELNTVSM